jgi:hypothetical protein
MSSWSISGFLEREEEPMQKRSLEADPARLAGEAARQAHELITTNPYPKGSDERRRWNAGWKVGTDRCAAYYSRTPDGVDAEDRPGAER